VIAHLSVGNLRRLWESARDRIEQLAVQERA
jgi:hypothetical protein